MLARRLVDTFDAPYREQLRVWRSAILRGGEPPLRVCIRERCRRVFEPQLPHLQVEEYCSTHCALAGRLGRGQQTVAYAVA